MTRPSNIDKILERQARFGEVRDRLASEGGKGVRRALAHLAEGPWITISRQLGAFGSETGRRLAEELHWQTFDKEIVSAIAHNSQTRETLLARLDERATGGINDYLAQMVVPGDQGQAAYLEQMIRVVWGIARQGNAIILGRGANYFLDAQFGLRVRLVAPLETRIERVARREGWDLPVAERAVRANDARQVAFIRQVYRRDLDDPAGFDLVLNTAALDVDTVVPTLLAAVNAKLRVRS